MRNFAFWILAVSCLELACLSPARADDKAEAGPKPLAQAHAHNDYAHRRPLHDALDHGFCSIEADVWLVGDELLVGHSTEELRPHRTLESLYLRPLAERCRQRDGWVLDKNLTVTLLIDFKSPGETTYPVLKEQLTKYGQLFVKPNDQTPPPIEVIITGDRPIELIRADVERLVSIDGRLDDLGSNESRTVMPLISDNWTKHFIWKGVGPMPEAEKALLRQHVAEVHSHHRRLRFWATPDSEAVWAELQNAGVDLIGADNLSKLQAFLTR